MGKKLPMARSKSGGKQRGYKASKVQTNGGMLLASSGPRLPEGPSSTRNKRKASATTAKEEKGRKAKDTPPASQVGTKAEDFDGGSTRRKGLGGRNKDRQSDSGAERKDRTSWRSAEELGIEWIGSYCQDSQPHFLIGTHKLDGGTLFRCRHCKRHIWLPYLMEDATKFDSNVEYRGAEDAYHRMLDEHPEAKILIAKLQYLWYERQKYTNMDEFTLLVISTMEDKNYGKRVP